MKISYKWLQTSILAKTWTNTTPLNIQQIFEILPDIGLEVEYLTKVEYLSIYFEKIIIGKILKVEKHSSTPYFYVINIDRGKKNIKRILNIITKMTSVKKTLLATSGSSIQDKKLGKKIYSEGIFCYYNKFEIFNNFTEGFMEFPTLLIPGVPAKQIFYIEKDYIIEILIPPNRSDAISPSGVARDLYLAMKLRIKKVLLKKPLINNFKTSGIAPPFQIFIESPKQCLRYSGCLLTNIKILPSPVWLQNFLKKIGITTINNIIDLTKFISYELGQPIHAFDAGKLIGKKLLIKKKENVNYIEKYIRIKKNDLIISDDNNLISLAGILGVKLFQVTANTETVGLESAYFDPINIRKSSKNQNIITDSSFRFERGIDLNKTVFSLKRAIYLIQHLTYNKSFFSDIIDVKSKYLFYKKNIILHYKKISDLLGIKIPKKTIKQILSSLEIKILLEYYNKLKIKIPKFRTDIFREIDIIEEILRIYGYNKIKITETIQFSINLNTIFNKKNIEEYVINFLISKGFYEVINISFLNMNYKKLMNHMAKDLIEIIYPLNQELSLLRPTILFSLLERVKYNINRKNNNLKFVELGKYYKKKNTKYFEYNCISLIITNDKKFKQNNWLSSKNLYSFFHLKGLIESILKILGRFNYFQKHYEDFFLYEQLFLIVYNKILIKLGKVKKNITNHFNIKQEVFYAEIDLDFFKNIHEEKNILFFEPSKYPSIIRDLSILIDKNILFEDIYHIAKSTGEKILKTIQLFDIYEGIEIPHGKKSYSLSFYIEDYNKTLTNKYVNHIMKKIQNILKQKLGAIIR